MKSEERRVTMKKVAIVILNWNGAAMMRRFLPSVIEHSSYVADIIVADNDSKDDSLALLKAEFPLFVQLYLTRTMALPVATIVHWSRWTMNTICSSTVT